MIQRVTRHLDEEMILDQMLYEQPSNIDEYQNTGLQVEINFHGLLVFWQKIVALLSAESDHETL